jgi:hypothetical protein
MLRDFADRVLSGLLPAWPPLSTVLATRLVDPRDLPPGAVIDRQPLGISLSERRAVTGLL